MRAPIYLDYAATTPVDPAVAARMGECLTMDGIFANPASRAHMYGWQAEEAVEDARGTIAGLLAADPREIVFTSGATESNNLAIKGYAEANAARGKHIVTSAIEHKAVLDTCKALEQRGFTVTYLIPGSDGLVSAAQVAEALRDDTILVSLMHVNNELGVINPVAEVGQLCREHGIALHVDAAQSAGKLAIDVTQMQVDLLSVSAHKMYGPKGIGVLYVRRSPDIQVTAQIHGGGHERGMRSGTLATHQIAGFGKAAELAQAAMLQEQEHIAVLAEQFWAGIASLPGVSRNGSHRHKVPGIINVTFEGCDGETLLISLNQLAVSTGSACTSASVEPSYVLKAIGLSDEKAHSALRFSLGRFTTEDDIRTAVEHIRETVTQMHKSARLSLGGI